MLRVAVIFLYILFYSFVHALSESQEIAAAVRIFLECEFIILNRDFKRLFAPDKAFEQTHRGKILEPVIEYFEPERVNRLPVFAGINNKRIAGRERLAGIGDGKRIRQTTVVSRKLV